MLPKRLTQEAPHARTMPGKTIPTRGLLALLAAVLAASVAGRALAQPTPAQPTPSQSAPYQPMAWTLHSSDAPVRIAAHQIEAQVAAAEPASELVRIEAGRGSYVYFQQPIDPAAVIADFEPSVWVRADQPGVQLSARVVLPRTQAPGGGALTVIVPGDVCQDRGAWRQLSLRNLPEQLQQTVRLTQGERHIAIDAGEAYVDMLLLNCYGGQGITSVWIGETNLPGAVRPVGLPPLARETPPGSGVPADPIAHSDDGPELGPGRAIMPSTQRAHALLEVALHGPVLTVAGQPFSPRAIVHNGEPLVWLKEQGFNSIWLAESPSAAVAEEARQCGMLLLGPSPTGSRPGGADARSLPEMMVSVHLPSCAELSREQAGQAAAELGRAKSSAWRPLVCRASPTEDEFCRVADILLADHAPLGTSAELASATRWYTRQAMLSRPGTPCWAMVQTEPSPQVERQMQQFAHSWLPELSVEPEQIRLLTYSAVAAGYRGIVFDSHSRLDGADPRTKLRATTLALLNRELAMLAPWTASGASRTTIATEDPYTQASVLHLERAKLLVVLRTTQGGQFVCGEPPEESASIVVPGIPPSYSIYRVLPTSLETLQGHRVTGGMRVAIDQADPVSLVLLTCDSRASTSILRTMVNDRATIAEQQTSIARQMLTLVENVDQQLSAEQTPRPPRATEQLDAARRQFEHAEQLLQTGDAAGSIKLVREAERALRRLRQQHWSLAVESESGPMSLPFTSHFAMLPYHWSAHEAVAEAQVGPNLLAGGGMENLEELMGTGWRHIQPDARYAEAGHEADVRLLESPHTGQSALRISAKGPQRVGEGSPLAIYSPTIDCEPGQVVCISCWVRAEPPAYGGPALVIDTWPGGVGMSESIQAAPRWTQVKLYRVVEDDGQVQVSFRLPGPGEAWVDDVTIHPVVFAGR